MLVATMRAGLRGVTGVNAFHMDTALGCFVANEAVELGKGPTMKASLQISLLAFAASNTGGLPDTREVFEDNGGTWGETGDNALAEDVVCIPVKTRLLAFEFLQVAFGGFTSFGLQFSLETEAASINFFPVLASKKLFVGGHSRAVESQIYPDHLLCRSNDRLRDIYHDMQPKLALTVTQVSRRDGIALIFCAESGNGEGNGNIALSARKPCGMLIPTEGVRSLIVADSTQFRLWHLHRLEDGNRLTSFPGVRDLLRVCRKLLSLPCICQVFASMKGERAFPLPS